MTKFDYLALDAFVAKAIFGIYLIVAGFFV